MRVRKIVSNLEVENPQAIAEFYRSVLGLEVVMDMGWIVMLQTKESVPSQITLATEGGSGTPLPELSVEVDDLDLALERIYQSEVPIEYGPVEEPWGVRRFFVRDPAGPKAFPGQHIDPARTQKRPHGHFHSARV